ncbi:flagellar biosynthetic protein FliR [Sulfuriferula thiophila]|uniref:flagellar biosynthetic protein FliR n=1 Tax=Sulfuriferula thiophila TaxID=1781211 RepID=UPI000F6055FD|nr:flagellar biosynthetic protein FliR [Sulfuriferula thiophila]
MISFTDTAIYAWLGGFIWPLTRILGLISAAPVFSHNSIPITSKIGLAVILAIIIGPTIPQAPTINPASLAGIMILIQQLIIGIAMGFAMRIIFMAVDMAGTITGMTMGFGFASFFDPQTQGQSVAISQLLTMLVTLVFLAINGHLILIEGLVESFTTLPIAMLPINDHGFLQLANWGGTIFSAGIQLSMPMVAALLITNIALGILTRSAPQLNLFGIGFPITLGIGFIVLTLALPYLATPMQALMQQGFNFTQQLFRN